MFLSVGSKFSCVKWDIDVKQALTLQVAGAQGGFAQTEMLSLDQESHEEEVKQLQQQVHIVNSLNESSEEFFFSPLMLYCPFPNGINTLNVALSKV